jgi:hypothetical protein
MLPPSDRYGQICPSAEDEHDPSPKLLTTGHSALLSF